MYHIQHCLIHGTYSTIPHAGLFVSRDNPRLPEIQEFLSAIQEPVAFDMIFTEIVQYLRNAGEFIIASRLEKQRATKSNRLHFFGLWLATAASTSRPSTWADFVQLLRKGGVDERVIQTVPGGPWGSHHGDAFHVTQQQPVTAAAVQELSLPTKQTDPPRGTYVCMCSGGLICHGSIAIINMDM